MEEGEGNNKESQYNHRSFITGNNNNTSSSSSSSLSSLSPPRVLRYVQASFDRNHPLRTMQPNSIKPRRTLIPQRGKTKNLTSSHHPTEDLNNTQTEVSSSQPVPVKNENQIDASITLPSICGTITNTYEDMKLDSERGQHVSSVDYRNDESQNVQMVDCQKKVQFSMGDTAGCHGTVGKQATGTDNLLSHMRSLALTEMDIDTSNQPEAATAIDEAKQSLLSKRTMELHDQLHHQFRNFLHGDMNLPITQSSVVGSSCAPTTLVNSSSAPILNSTTYGAHLQENNNSNGDNKVTFQPVIQENKVLPTCPSSCSTDIAKESKGKMSEESDLRKDIPNSENKLNLAGLPSTNATEIQIRPTLSENPSSNTKSEPTKPEKQDKPATSKGAPRKRGYDPDLFFKVNGKLYQKLGKIGSGGSSEVHKVISSDCQIYALKKIKLKGRDYATAYGFCQEIEYLNKLKGKNHIIQLIDYEVTDKALLREVLNGSMSNKDGRVKEDGFIYMVLEYGEIDLAHMLSHKWKEMDITNSPIDDNWLRFYWQQILQAVNTIHEERIVHSDLKPANFLLVRGSLKLIDFGIAKAIMSDTTNIQRDSQVGTLSYMSPEAFLCNETDADGNIIKCGRPSDIWSLGCILYQMVYGQTPFSEYKTFWAKFKVITDPNHKITYEPVSNPWLLDLMKKCLAWDRNKRWRIPQLLKHPFLVPPVAPQLSSLDEQNCKLLQLVAESCSHNPKAWSLCRQLQEQLTDTRQ